jgi:hypothetical protein
MDQNRVNLYKSVYNKHDSGWLADKLARVMEMLDRYMGVTSLNTQQTVEELKTIFDDIRVADIPKGIKGDPSLN